jgi:DNA-binding transcriptional LysR family regulator
VSQEPEPDLVARKLAVNRKVLCAAPAYLLALHGTPRVIDDLTGHDGVLFPPLAPKRVWTFHRDGQQHAVPVTARFETDDMDALHAAVVAGMGIGVLPVYVAADDMRRGRLVPPLREFQLLPDVDIYLAYLPNRTLSRRVRALIDFLVQRFEPAPPWETDW